MLFAKLFPNREAAMDKKLRKGYFQTELDVLYFIVRGR